MRYNDNHSGSCVVRMRGLPFDSTAADILKFFHDCSISQGERGVHLTRDNLGRPSGEAYVVFDSPEDAKTAMGHDREHMGRRYVELFTSSEMELGRAVPEAGVGIGPRQQHHRSAPPSHYGPGGGGGQHNGEPVLRMRGLPFDADFAAIREFFREHHVVKDGILMVYGPEGRSSGEAYVQFDGPETAERALSSCNRRSMGSRYIELFPSSMAEAYAEANRQQIMSAGGGDQYAAQAQQPQYGYNYGATMGEYSEMGSGGGSMRGGRGSYGGGGGNARPSPYGAGGGGGGGRRGEYGGGGGGTPGSDWASTTGNWVHMRGLPYTASVNDIRQFFAPLSAAHIELHYNADGRPSGEADVDFDSEADCRRAMEKNKQHIGSRYVDLFIHKVSGRYAGGGGGGGGGGGQYQAIPPPRAWSGDGAAGGGGGGGGFRVHLRGLPWSAGDSEVLQFFAPLRPTRVEVGRDAGGRSTGEADAYFQSAEDARQAAEYNGRTIGTRYIEIFTN